jgi:uncharacterized protein YcfJ
MKWGRYLLVILVAAAVSGCATMPSGPSVMVLPAAGKSFETFQADDQVCRDWAARQTGAPPADTVNQNIAGSAVVGTLMGAGLGAAIGAASGDAGVGAAIGAGVGALGGTAVGSQAGFAAGSDAQRRYDNAYQQCMYAKGNQIPGVQREARRAQWVPPPPPPPSYTRAPFTPPPPPPGAPPPPPPGVQPPPPYPQQ